MSLAVLLTLAIGCMHCAGVCGAAGEDLVLLGQRITQGYVKRFRPVLHWDQPVTVYLDLSLYSILDLVIILQQLTGADHSKGISKLNKIIDPHGNP
ncbi:5-hydroxytryptamine receptor 3B-like [Acipenser oxyrinchus oxyrinchus]|uniref:5-hydroxytryptamine receptor 3B-like n=1 Tax=Acipenser oxyrinchus oxyrinchus TaxID=40147 RepID=A0AAD8GJG1_ACIOX|nr:5-hydroxytryptamine receptor 3B-like [Acipenser oxyrinchus oxyrinchus]